MQKTITLAVFFLLSITLLISSAKADRGLIPVYPGVSVYEPGQKAIIAWNGNEEILILSTDLTATDQTIVLELMPLPSEPTVEPASFQAFEQIQSHIWNKGTSVYGMDNNAVRTQSVQIIFHQEIGTHNITVVRATDTTELVNWIKNFTEANKIAEIVSLGEYQDILEEYMNRGFRYYVLDLITVTTDLNSHNPILYRFDSSYLYYPLAITSPVQGTTEITLFLLTNGKIEKDYFPITKALYYTPDGTKPIEAVLSKSETSKIDLRIGQLFTETAWLTVMEYKGSPSTTAMDLMITTEAVNPKPNPDNPVIINVDLTPPLTLVTIGALIGAACTITGFIFAALMTRPKK